MHQTVLLNEAVDALMVDPDGVYVDGTFGRGGHSARILQQLSAQGRLIVVDKDPQAIAVADALAQEDERVQVVHGSFADIAQHVAPASISGVLLDLGVSSPQLDEAERGFSFMQDGPLDMRMNTSSGETAAQWLAYAEAEDIALVLKEFGEERHARRIARAIVAEREQQALETTGQLAELIARVSPSREKHKHPATRSFQAIRIFINRELDDLQLVLAAALDVLKAQGRLVVISFHSLEDRIVKRFMRDQQKGRELPRHIPVTAEQMHQPRLVTVGKAIKPSDQEVADNVRARSAVMRIAMRTEVA